VVNACRDLVRRGRRRPQEAFGARIEPTAAGDDFRQVADHDQLERAFTGLPADQRIALVLTHYVGYSAPEVARILDVPTGTVYSRLHYGARAMREALAGPTATTTASEPVR
jgi:RNA polymerase sigma-70 factor (ECF subfamily)